ncbi:hypothetical protein HYX09_02875 [Candidatus Woesearchaeota archaeon]|nr:hypothetical protein [Candidatus Woesearchaeota archaeon]
MDAETTYLWLKNIALQEFPDAAISATVLKGPLNTPQSLRIFLIDNSFLEVWLSGNKYSYHWQRTDGKIYRHDNAPHKKHMHIKTFPKHFHEGSEDNARESHLSENADDAIREVLRFIRKRVN